MYILAKQVRKVWWAQNVLGFKSNFQNFLLNAFIDFQLIKFLKGESDVTQLRSSKYEACCHILSKLQRPQRAFRKTSKKRIAIVGTTKNNRRALTTSKNPRFLSNGSTCN